MTSGALQTRVTIVFLFAAAVTFMAWFKKGELPSANSTRPELRGSVIDNRSQPGLTRSDTGSEDAQGKLVEKAEALEPGSGMWFFIYRVGLVICALAGIASGLLGIFGRI